MDSITVLVGEEETQFVLHKTFVSNHSEFFNKACNSEWKESIEAVVRLPEIEPHVFGVYIGWLYTGCIDVSKDAEEAKDLEYKPGMEVEDDDAIRETLVSSYTLGDALLDYGFQNAIITEFIQFTETIDSLPHPREISTLWDQIVVGSTMARLLVDYMAVDFSPETFIQQADDFPSGLVLEIAKAGVRDAHLSRDDRKPKRRDKCFYHTHKHDSDKCA